MKASKVGFELDRRHGIRLEAGALGLSLDENGYLDRCFLIMSRRQGTAL